MNNDSAYSPLLRKPPVCLGHLQHPDKINSEILRQYEAVKNESDIKKTHHFMGRFENTYIPEDRIPAIRAILDMGRFYASQILSLDAQKFRMGFWFNEMHPGHQTTLHTHEEDDELLSAVYYIKAAENSGDLVVHGNTEHALHFPPQQGRMIFFGPEVPHSVETNNSEQMRLSIAINFGRIQPVC